MKVLITRQTGAAINLMTQLAKYQVSCECLPLFAIEPILDHALLQQIYNNLTRCDLGVVVSRNAAELVLPHVDIAAHMQWATIGPATARYLQQHGIAEVIYPADPRFDSAALLQEFARRKIQLSNKYIMIFTGADGNTWLEGALQQRGATVSVVPVYKRTLPQFAADHVAQVFNVIPKIDIILITCVTSLQNLWQITQNIGLEIFDTPLLVVSERIYNHAIDMGFVNVYTTKSMADADVLSALFNWRG